MSDLSGKEIHGYQLLERIGQGGFGAVYRAEQPAVGREVAIKVILPEHAEHPEFTARFEAEARTVAKLEHPHIVPLYDYWKDEHGAFLVMRYLKGGSLRDRLEAEGAQPPGAIAPVLEQVCEALEAAHERGVIHRDLKPENVLLDERGQAYLSDFGIAKDFERGQLTRTGTMIGSAAYVSPEVAKGEQVTPQADIYGLGILLYELLAGEHPFPDLDPIQLVQHQLSASLPPVSRKAPGVPGGIDTLIQKATAKIPAHRYRSAGELLEAYRALLGKGPEKAPSKRTAGMPGFLEAGLQEQPVPAFVGRQSELQELETRLERVVDGRGEVIFLIGGAGQGKTALSLSFARRAQQTHPELLVAYGECNAQSGIGDPYLPFREVIEMLCGEVESAWSTGILTREGARRLWGAHPRAIQALLENGPDLVDTLVPAVSLQARAAAEQDGAWAAELAQFLERKALFQGVTPVKQLDLFEQATRVLREVAERSPLLLIFDDLQWADDASISLLFHLSRRIADRPILLLCAYRPDEVALGRDGERHPLEQVVNEVKRTQGKVVIDLGRTEAEEGMGFIQAFLDSEPNQLGSEFHQALFEHTGGHPLFTVELLRAMQERGDLVQRGGVWVEGESLAWDQLPARVEAVIEERIARLEEEIRDLLLVASVEGNDFTAQVLARVQKVEERKLLHELSQELGKRHRLVREMGEVTAGKQILSRFQFAHHLFQRYLYNGMSAAERRLLHGEITAVLEEIFQGEEERISIQLAYHSQRANQPEKAIRYLRLAGDQAKSSYANQDAVRHYSELLHLLPERNQGRFEVLQARSSVYHVMAEREKQEADAKEMLEIAHALNEKGLQIDAQLALADVHIEREHVLAQAPAKKALELAEHTGDLVRQAHAMRRLGWAAWHRTDFAASREYLEGALDRFLEADRAREAAECMHTLSLVLGSTNEFKSSLEVAMQAVELSQQIGDRRLEATSLRRLAIAQMALDQYAAALSIAERALALHREVGDWTEEANALNVVGILYGWERRWQESEAALRESLQRGHDLQSTTAIQFAAWNLATTHYWRLGCYEQAVRLLDHELELAMAAEDDWLIGSIHWYRGIMRFELGLCKAAQPDFEIVHSMAEQLAPQTYLQYEALAWAGLINCLLGERAIGVEQIEQALQWQDEQPGVEGDLYPGLAVLNAIRLLPDGDPAELEEASQRLDRGLDAISGTDKYENLEERLNASVRVRLALDDLETAHAHAQELARLLDFVPAHPATQEYAYTIAQVHWAQGNQEQGDRYLKRAWDWINLVAGQTENEEWRRSWLEDARRNAEILQVAAERGVA